MNRLNQLTVGYSNRRFHSPSHFPPGATVSCKPAHLFGISCVSRPRVVSNFGDSGEIHERARENGLPRGDAPRGAHFLARARARVYFAGIAKIRD